MQSSQAPTVFVVEGNRERREKLAAVVQHRELTAALYEDAESFLAAYRDEPGCLISAIRLPGIGGPNLLERLRGEGLCLPVIFVCADPTIANVVRVFKAGAFDLFELPYHDDELLDRVQDAILHDVELRSARTSFEAVIVRLRSLSPREHEVTTRVAEGNSNKEISNALGISEKTVEAHRASAKRKLGAVSTPHLVRMVYLARFATERISTRPNASWQSPPRLLGGAAF